jgi:hypothetical protein
MQCAQPWALLSFSFLKWVRFVNPQPEITFLQVLNLARLVDRAFPQIRPQLHNSFVGFS